MTIYNYIALKNNKDIVKGKVNAEDLREARESIRSLGFIPTKVYEEKLKVKKIVKKRPKSKVVKLKNLACKIEWILPQLYKFWLNQVFQLLNP